MNTDISRSDATFAFARIGLLSFGGPASQIAVMHRILVEEKKWLTEQQFLHALNFCMLLPGPEAMQLATYAGWLMHGVRGGLIAGLLFILPGLAMMLAVSAIYVSYGNIPIVAGLLFGLKAAVLAVVLQALVKVSSRALGSPFVYVLAVLAFVAIFFLQIAFPIIILAAALIGYVTHLFRPAWLPVSHAAETNAETSDRTIIPSSAMRQTIKAIIVYGGIWLLALGALGVLAANEFATEAALFFSKTAAVTFGGAYAVLAFVGQQAVDFYGWLSADDMLKGLGLAETTLGPLVLVLVFVGYVGGANGGFGGLAGGLIAAFFTFVPCFLWIFAGAPHMERLRHLRWLSASLAAVTASVVGVIANLAVWFGLSVLFGELTYLKIGWVHIPTFNIAEFDYLAAIIAIASGFALLRLKANMMLVLACSAIAGILVSSI